MAEFQPDKFAPLWQLPFEGAWPMAVAFIGPRRLAAGNRLGQIFVWTWDEAATKDTPPKAVRRLDGHTNGITRLIGAPDGRTLISAALDRTVRIWDLDAPATGQAEVVLDAESRAVEAKRTGKKDALERPGTPVELQTSTHVLDAHREWVQSLGMSRNGQRIISGDDAGVSIVWDLATRAEISRWKGNPLNWVVSAALSPDGQSAFTAEYTHPRGDFDRPPAQARFRNANTGEELLDLLVVQFPDVKVRDNSYGYAVTWAPYMGRGFVCSDVSPDGKLLAVGKGGEIDKGVVHVIDVESGKLLRSTPNGHLNGVTDVKFSASGEYVLSTGRDTTLAISRVADGQEVARLGKPRGGQSKDWLAALAISPDETALAAADISGIIQVWRAETMAPASEQTGTPG